MQEVTELFEMIRQYRVDSTTSTVAAMSALSCTACLNKYKKQSTKSEMKLKKEDQVLVHEFEGYLQTVMESLANQLGKNLTETEKKIEVLKSKFFLTDVCFEKAVEILSITFKGYENPFV